MYSTLSAFYTGKEWREFREVIIAERTQADGFVYDEITGKPIVMAYDIILHHIEPLTLDNVNDANISLNPANIQVISFKTHNALHNRFGKWTRHIYLVYGCPLAGKNTFVKERADIHSLVIDIDKIYECITNNPKYTKTQRLYDNMRSVYDALLNDVKYKRGKWTDAFIIGGFPLKRDREAFVATYGAEEVFIQCDKETALERLATGANGRDTTEYKKHIDNWFMRYQA